LPPHAQTHGICCCEKRPRRDADGRAAGQTADPAPLVSAFTGQFGRQRQRSVVRWKFQHLSMQMKVGFAADRTHPVGYSCR
jgi:hypothetical protein